VAVFQRDLKPLLALQGDMETEDKRQQQDRREGRRERGEKKERERERERELRREVKRQEKGSKGGRGSQKDEGREESMIETGWRFRKSEQLTMGKKEQKADSQTTKNHNF
jgi:hypothetical protein